MSDDRNESGREEEREDDEITVEDKRFSREKASEVTADSEESEPEEEESGEAENDTDSADHKDLTLEEPPAGEQQSSSGGEERPSGGQAGASGGGAGAGQPGQSPFGGGGGGGAPGGGAGAQQSPFGGGEGQAGPGQAGQGAEEYAQQVMKKFAEAGVEGMFMSVVQQCVILTQIYLGLIPNPNSGVVQREPSKASKCIDLLAWVLENSDDYLGQREEQEVKRALSKFREIYVDLVESDGDAPEA